MGHSSIGRYSLHVSLRLWFRRCPGGSVGGLDRSPRNCDDQFSFLQRERGKMGRADCRNRYHRLSMGAWFLGHPSCYCCSRHNRTHHYYNSRREVLATDCRLNRLLKFGNGSMPKHCIATGGIRNNGLSTDSPRSTAHGSRTSELTHNISAALLVEQTEFTRHGASRSRAPSRP
jgi:hypothetical protein